MRTKRTVNGERRAPTFSHSVPRYTTADVIRAVTVGRLGLSDSASGARLSPVPSSPALPSAARPKGVPPAPDPTALRRQESLQREKPRAEKTEVSYNRAIMGL